jgi:hypothetical protein
MRVAGKFNPFDQQARGASARVLAATVLQQTNDKFWLEAARTELINALKVDYSAADMLLKLIVIDLKLDRIEEANFMYEQFKRVDPKSPVIAEIEKARQTPK